MASNPSFSPSCPDGSNWYACGSGAKFVGCCKTDPCGSNGCPYGQLEPASFNASAYGSFSDQECTSGSWYTCAQTKPPFLGCCRSTACTSTGGCPLGDLSAGFLSNDNSLAQQFDPNPPLGGTATSQAGPSTVQTSTPNPTMLPSAATVSNTTTPSTSAPNASNHAGVIAGGVIGGVAVIGVIIAVVLYMTLRYVRRPQTTTARADPSDEFSAPQSLESAQIPASTVPSSRWDWKTGFYSPSAGPLQELPETALHEMDTPGPPPEASPHPLPAYNSPSTLRVSSVGTPSTTFGVEPSIWGGRSVVGENESTGLDIEREKRD